MTYDPTMYLGTAVYYVQGRPPYSRELAPTLAAEAGLDGAGRLLDVGCGPGVLTTLMAGYVEEVIGLDPDADMLGEGRRRALEAGITNIRWVQARAEEIAELGLGRFRLVTFGQSFHWTDRERVAEMVFDLLEPGGILALIGHQNPDRPVPEGPGHPPIPHDAIRALLESYLGPRRRAGQGFANLPSDPYEDLLTRTSFGRPRQIFCPGRPDIVQDIDGVFANYFSTSFAAPHLFGERLDQFKEEFRAVLIEHSPNGLFWDWPGDTAMWLAKKSL